jgi:DNA-binding cell septation regulator SpoVG
LEYIKKYVVERIKIMAKTQNTAPVTEAAERVMNEDEQARAEEQYYLLEAPIAELAERAGADIDGAVKMRVAAAIEATPPKMELSVRTIDPIGQLHGYASVKIGGMTIDGFKIFERKEDGGLFVGMPSKKVKSGFKDTVFVDRDFREDFNTAVISAYHKEGEKLMARAPPSRKSRVWPSAWPRPGNRRRRITPKPRPNRAARPKTRNYKEDGAWHEANQNMTPHVITAANLWAGVRSRTATDFLYLCRVAAAAPPASCKNTPAFRRN